jgi:hypothetical protein
MPVSGAALGRIYGKVVLQFPDFVIKTFVRRPGSSMCALRRTASKPLMNLFLFISLSPASSAKVDLVFVLHSKSNKL